MRKVDENDLDFNRIRYKSSPEDDSDIISKYIIKIVKPVCVKLGLSFQSTTYKSISIIDIYIGENSIRFKWYKNLITCIKYDDQVNREVGHYIIDLHEGFTRDDIISLLTTKSNEK